MITVVPVILCGGSGSRLWPLSRNGFPKQFLALAGNESLFQQTVMRASKIGHLDITTTKPVIVTNEEHRFLAVEQLRELDTQASFLLEPIGKNTAPALTMASLFVQENYSDQEEMHDDSSFEIIGNKQVFSKTLNNIKTKNITEF